LETPIGEPRLHTHTFREIKFQVFHTFHETSVEKSCPACPVHKSYSDGISKNAYLNCDGSRRKFTIPHIPREAKKTHCWLFLKKV